MTTGRLGRNPVKFDARTFQASKYMRAVSPPPASVDWQSPVPVYGMFKNDVLGCCTIAADGHFVQEWTFDATSNEVTVSDADIITAYSAVSGYDPATGANDNGANELDVLNYLKKTGLGGHKIAAFVQLDVKNKDQLKQAINVFGGIYIGVNMPISAQNQTDNGRVWDAEGGNNGEPGSWGGHAVHCGKYDDSQIECVTWGERQPMTWAFWDKYVEEAYAILSVDFLNGGKDPQGFDIATLTNDLAAVGNNQPFPEPTPDPNPNPDPGPTPTPPPTPIPTGNLTITITDMEVVNKVTKAVTKKGVSADEYVTERLAKYFHVQ